MTDIQDYPQPLYLQVEATLKEMMDHVEYGPGDKIPPERELAEMLGVSRMTVRRAIENLIRSGVLERRSTTGTFVRQPQVVRDLGSEAILGLSQMLEKSGVKPGSRLISFETLRAPQKVAKYLNIRVGQMVCVIRRLRLADGEPFCIETVYLAADLLPGISESDLEKEVSFYKLLRERYGIFITKSEESYNISYATANEAELLGIAVDDAVLFKRGITYDDTERPIEYLKSINHPKRVVFETVRRS